VSAAPPDISDLPDPSKDNATPDISDLPVPKQGEMYSPTDDMSWSDRLAAGVGKGMVDTGRGVYQLGASLGHAAGLVSDEKMKEIQQDVDSAHERDQALMNTGWGKAGDIIGAAIPAAFVPGTGIMGGAAAGAAMGAAQPVPTGESRAQNMGLGAAGGAAGGAVGKVFKWLGGFGVPEERQASVDLLNKEGIPTSVAQKTASKGAQTAERASSMISDDQRDFMAAQQPKFNAAVLRRIGVADASKADPDVMDKAEKAITGVMDDVGSRGVKVDDEMLNGLGDAEYNATRQLPDTDLGPIKAHVSDILSNAAKNDGQLDGVFYQKVRTSLRTLSKDPRYAPFAHDMQDVVDDALERSNPEDAAALTGARQQYRKLMQIEPAIDSNGNIGVLPLMRSLMNKSNRNQAIYGRGDQSLMGLAKAARQIIPENLANSGTAERSIPTLTALEIAQSGEPFKAALKAGAAFYSGAVAGRAMRNQGPVGNMLAKGLPGVRTVSPAVQTVAPALGYGAGESKERDVDQPAPDFGTLPADAIQRAAGGKVDDIEPLVSRLMGRWKSAKKATDASTKPLLHVPDATIQKALEIAGRGI
jgi:hypothetical protein